MMIRAAVLAAPVAACGGASPSPAPTPAPVAREAPPATTTDGVETTAVAPSSQDGEMDPDEFDRQWRESLSRGREEGVGVITVPQGGNSGVIVSPGRPLLDGERLVVAPSGPASWALAQATLGHELPPALRARVAMAWTDAALAEHASVASFARAAIELMAVGAPRELVDGHLAAGRDELRHAELAFTLAAAYGALEAGPGPLVSPPPRAGGVAALARRVFEEGCVNETVAALAAERAAGRAEPAPVRDALAVLAADEAGHASLAWRTLRWALSADPDAAAGLSIAPSAAAPADPDADRLAKHGVLDGAALAACRRDAVERVVRPLLEELLQS